MAVFGQGADSIKHVLGNNLTGLPLGNNFVNLSLSRNITGQQHIPERLNSRIFGVRSLWQCLKGLRNGLTAETDAFLGIQVGDIGYQVTDVTGTADALIDGYFINLHLAEFFYQTGGAGAMLFNLLLEGFLQSHAYFSFRDNGATS